MNPLRCRVRDFEVMDVYPFGAQLTWEKEGAPTTSVVFERNGPLPSTKSLTFYRYLPLLFTSLLSSSKVI